MTTADNCPVTGRKIVKGTSERQYGPTQTEDYGIKIQYNRRYTSRPDLISYSMSQYYQGLADWQTPERTAKESTGEHGRNLDGVWGWTEDQHRHMTVDEILDAAESADGSSGVCVQIRANSKETLEEIRDAVASQVPKYCKTHTESVTNHGDDWGWSLSILYYESPTYQMGEFNETGVKRASKIIPALRAVLSEGDY